MCVRGAKFACFNDLASVLWNCVVWYYFVSFYYLKSQYSKDGDVVKRF